MTDKFEKECWTVVVFDVCSSSILVEDLTLTDRLERYSHLLNRLKEHQQGVLAFAFVQYIPFTNNQAERDIRCLKTKQKMATSFRTFNGAKTYARIQSFVSTLRKHDMNVFQNLINVLNQKQVGFNHA